MDVITNDSDKRAQTTSSDEQKHNAAIVVQRAWRTYAQRKDRLSADAHWKESHSKAEEEVANKEAAQETNDTRSRFRRGVFLAAKLADGNSLASFEEKHGWRRHKEPKLTKELESQHVLEFVDPKHRYGSNCNLNDLNKRQGNRRQFYHQKWMNADTNANFFEWLDEGDAKDLSLPECSREQLEAEQIIFLTPEQRLNYLIKIDPEGKIRWEHNNEYVDTTPGKWVDARGGKGIVRSEGEEGQKKQAENKKRPNNEDESDVAETARHYEGITGDRNLNAFQRLWKDRFTTNGLMERLLRKTVRKNTWLYVSDNKFNVFVGIKETGYFQHSSFTSGGQVTSAGLIEVENGLVQKLSPLSGHYRTGIGHFKQFLEAMDERGMDLHKIHVTKGESLLWGLEHWKGFTKSVKDSKKKAHHVAHVTAHPHKAKEEKEEKKRKEEEDKRAREQVDAAEAAAVEAEEESRNEAVESTIRKKLERSEEKKNDQPRASSSRPWSVLTSRSQKQGEDKWRTAMERKEELESPKGKAPASTKDGTGKNAAPNGEAHGSAPKSTEPTTASNHQEEKPDTPQERPPPYAGDGVVPPEKS